MAEWNPTLQTDLEQLAEQTGFSGVAVVGDGRDRVATVTAGLANRAHNIPIAVGTRFGCASATKGFTALAVASLIDEGKLTLDTPLGSLVGAALTVDPGVTIEHLLGHTSGVGDYLDEEQLGDIDDHVLAGVSAHRFERPHHYLPLLNQYPQVSPPGTRFAYNNSGYIMLSLAIERAGGHQFQQAVTERVLTPAGMTASGFLRSDDLPGDAATGYLENGRTNVFHLPVIGGGDGGAYTTADDMDSFWTALFDERIVSGDLVNAMTAARSTGSGDLSHYGLGFWVGQDKQTVMLEGMDAGVSFRSAHHRPSGRGFTVLSNTSSGVWPLVAHLTSELAR